MRGWNGGAKMASSVKKYLDPDLERHFPNLTRQVYEVKSNPTPFTNANIVLPYNCIAFAAGDDKRWWWPDGVHYWPAGVTQEETVEAFIEMFESLGYEKCEKNNPAHEPGFDKVAIYWTKVGNPWTLPKSPTHAALQIHDGIWKSKLGEHEDIEHINLECLTGDDMTGRIEPYGVPVQIMKRRRGLVGLLIRAVYKLVRFVRIRFLPHGLLGARCLSIHS